MTHPLLWLALVTFLLIIAFAAWNFISAHRASKHDRPLKGVGGKNDPLG